MKHLPQAARRAGRVQALRTCAQYFTPPHREKSITFHRRCPLSGQAGTERTGTAGARLHEKMTAVRRDLLPTAAVFLRSLTHFLFTAENSSENLRFPPADFSAFLSEIFPARQSSAAPFTSEKPIGAGSGTKPSGRMRVREKRHAGRPRNGSLHDGRTSAGLRPETAGGC